MAVYAVRLEANALLIRRIGDLTKMSSSNTSLASRGGPACSKVKVAETSDGGTI